MQTNFLLYPFMTAAYTAEFPGENDHNCVFPRRCGKQHSRLATAPGTPD
jgi:hypothetical protein